MLPLGRSVCVRVCVCVGLGGWAGAHLPLENDLDGNVTWHRIWDQVNFVVTSKAVPNIKLWCSCVITCIEQGWMTTSPSAPPPTPHVTCVFFLLPVQKRIITVLIHRPASVFFLVWNIPAGSYNKNRPRSSDSSHEKSSTFFSLFTSDHESYRWKISVLFSHPSYQECLVARRRGRLCGYFILRFQLVTERVAVF